MQELATHLGLQQVSFATGLNNSMMGLCVQVGWIFTDLEPEGRNGKVAYKRSIVSAGNIVNATFHSSFLPSHSILIYSLLKSAFWQVTFKTDTQTHVDMRPLGTLGQSLLHYVSRVMSSTKWRFVVIRWVWLYYGYG